MEVVLPLSLLHLWRIGGRVGTKFSISPEFSFFPSVKSCGSDRLETVRVCIIHLTSLLWEMLVLIRDIIMFWLCFMLFCFYSQLGYVYSYYRNASDFDSLVLTAKMTVSSFTRMGTINVTLHFKQTMAGSYYFSTSLDING